MDTDHLQHGIGGRQELAHDDLKKSLALKFLVLVGKLHAKLVNKSEDLLTAVVVDSTEDLEDGVQDELVEGALGTFLGGVGPLFGLHVEVVFTLYR